MKTEQEVRDELTKLRNELDDIENTLENDTESDALLDDRDSTQARIDALEWVLY